MVGTSKIQNEQEVVRWFEEGRSYGWMMQEYLRKYKIHTTISMWGNFRRRHGLDLRMERSDVALVPWKVKEEHRWAYALAMLRVEARLRRGATVREEDAARLASWKAKAEASGTVVHYDPDTERGFWMVPRRPGVDVDLIRVPDHADTVRWVNDDTATTVRG